MALFVFNGGFMEQKEIVKTAELIKKAIIRHPNDIVAYEDYFGMVRAMGEADKKLSFEYDLWLRSETAKQVRMQTDGKLIEKFYELNKKTYLYMAPDDFHSYLITLEWNRPVAQRFYQPRMRIMKRVTSALQKLTDGELDELFLSEPPRVGKTTMLMFYVTWLIGRDSEKSNLYSAYSDVITSAFYNGCLEVINDPTTYLWHDIFPSAKLVATNSKDETLNIDRKKRYPSLTCRSLYGTLNGACDCNGVLISDDLIGGIEEALNKDRLITAWSKVDNNLIPRAKETAKILWCGTRWSLVDPTGLRMELLLNDDKFKNRKFDVINLPALNENDESNFEYDHGVGFSTDYYKMRRASFERNNDMASWEAQYMGKPIERSGALFDPADMKYYNGTLPDETPIRIFMAIDPAFGGGDFVASPICYQYEDGRVFVHDVVYSDADKKITQPLIVSKIINHKVQAADFEVTKSTAAYKETVEEQLKDKGHKITITSHSAPTNVAKEIRIRDKAPEVREMYFIESGKRSKEYELFMQNVFSFSITGKNKHDDAPDSLAQAVDMIRGVRIAVVEIGNRTF
jgi:predicted phage terminase large subunit-like protein